MIWPFLFRSKHDRLREKLVDVELMLIRLEAKTSTNTEMMAHRLIDHERRLGKLENPEGKKP